MLNPSALGDELRELLSDYPATSGYNELFNSDGSLRACWQSVLEELADLGLEGLHQRSEEIQSLLYENGLTFNVYEDDASKLRSWQLDPVPFVISTQDWESLEAGLIQRSRLLEALVEDLYGERRVISEGILPPELIYAHPSWLFAAADDQVRADRPWLIFHGTDVVRDQQGAWRVLSDWTQAPSGAGYALENRVLLARALSTLYRDAPLRRLAGFLQAQHRCLAQLAGNRREEPNIVLLTPGPGSPSYFEHAWLANYMNFSLVEGADLVVRDGQVAMRTLGGLKAVDVILCQVTDPWCDPLELRGDSLMGVPGLMQAARRGEVEIANALGVGVLEHPALSCFLPALCEYLLGEPLRLKGRKALWCGEAENLQRLLKLPLDWQLREVTRPNQLIQPDLLTATQREDLQLAMQQAPHLYVGQQTLPVALAPSFNPREQRLEPQPVSLRFFSLADSSEVSKPAAERQHRIMPGGLAWVGEPGTPVMESNLVKDIWVLAPVTQPHVSLLRQAQGPVVVTRDGKDLPSRVADSLFWMGRYGERLDNRVRLLRETLGHLLEGGQLPLEQTLFPDLFSALGVTLPDFGSSEETPALIRARKMKSKRSRQFILLREKLLSQLGGQAPASLPWLFNYFLRNSRAVRDHLGDDAWRTLNSLGQQVAGLPHMQGVSSGRRSLEGLITHLAAFFGLCNETMPHHYGWRFMDIGRYLERLLTNLELLKLALITARQPGIPLWEVVLATTDNLTVYRRRYRSQLHPSAILDLLLFDEANPRSAGYMLKRLERQIEGLPQLASTPFRSRENRLIIQARSRLHLVDLDSLVDLETSEAARQALAVLLDQLLEPIASLSEAIAHSHFSHIEAPKQLVTLQVSR